MTTKNFKPKLDHVLRAEYLTNKLSMQIFGPVSVNNVFQEEYWTYSQRLHHKSTCIHKMLSGK